MYGMKDVFGWLEYSDALLSVGANVLNLKLQTSKPP